MDKLQKTSEIFNINGIECYEENGVAYLKLETVARGLGFTQIAKSGNVVVRWERVYKYLQELNVPTCGDDGFIPENIFYRLAMKAKNEAAEAFQAKIADEVIPTIRKHGAYMTPEKIKEVLTNPDTIIELATTLKAEQERNQALYVENVQQKQIIGELQAKADYTDLILKNKSLVTITQIAKDYGMSGQAMNEELHKLGVQYKMNDQWLLYAKYHNKGYTHSETISFNHADGKPDTKMNTKWTQKGRLFIYELLKKEGIIPVIEREIAG